MVESAKMTARGKREPPKEVVSSVIDSSSWEEFWRLVNWSFLDDSERLVSQGVTPFNSRQVTEIQVSFLSLTVPLKDSRFTSF